MKKVVYPGSFDPITNGHIDVIVRAMNLFDEVIVTVAENRSKAALFSVEERMDMIGEVTRQHDRVQVDHFNGLVVEYAFGRGACAIIRGLRAISDFEFEFQMALMNRHMQQNLTTVFLMPNAKYTYLNSSVIKEVASMGGDISDFVPPYVAQKIKAKYGF